MAVNPVNNLVYVANMLSGTVSVINGTTDKVTSLITFNTNPPNSGFIECNVILIPQELWTPLYGIIPAVIASSFIPSLLVSRKEKRESKRYLKYYSERIGILDKHKLKNEITQLYKEGKINEADYSSL